MGRESFRHIAAYSGTSTGALQRHKADHLPASLAKASEAAEVVRGDGLLARLHELTADARGIKVKAEAAGDFRTALAGVRELVRIVELLGKLQGEFVNKHEVKAEVASIVFYHPDSKRYPDRES